MNENTTFLEDAIAAAARGVVCIGPHYKQLPLSPLHREGRAVREILADAEKVIDERDRLRDVVMRIRAGGALDGRPAKDVLAAITEYAREALEPTP